MSDNDVDYMTTFEGANFLAEMIRKYWSKRGYTPTVWVEKMGHKITGDGIVYCVRSNMLNGFPVNG